MASTLKLFSIFLAVLFLVEGGMGQNCKTSDISISQSKTGRKVPAGSEFVVVVTNNCRCSQFNLVVGCPGLGPQTKVDPRWLKPIGGGNCLVNSGYAIVGLPVRFFYASSSQIDLSPKKSDVRC